MPENSIVDEIQSTEAELLLVKERERQRQIAERNSQITELKRLLSVEESQKRYIASIEKYAPLLTTPVLEKSGRLKNNRPNHEWVIVLSDIHTGQKTTNDATGGLFIQTTEHTKKQMKKLWSVVEELHSISSKSINITKLTIIQAGDLIEGDGMRPSQATRIDELVTKQTMDTVDLLGEFGLNALSIFPVVDILNVGGNHDRTSQKPGYAGLGELGATDTYAWLIAEFERRMFTKAIAEGRMTLKNFDSYFGTTVIANQRIVFEHGASFRPGQGSYGGVPWYPICNAARLYDQMLGGVDIVIFGHFHMPAALPFGKGWQILNGAFPPSTEYVQSSFKKITTPSQTLLDLHPDHGLVNYKPIYLPVDNVEDPKNFWKNLELKCN